LFFFPQFVTTDYITFCRLVDFLYNSIQSKNQSYMMQVLSGLIQT